MATINANTIKMIDCGNDIIKKATECGTLLTDIFNKLENIDKTAWNGTTANRYAAQIRVQKVQYQNLVNTLINYGKVMKNAGDRLESNARKCN